MSTNFLLKNIKSRLFVIYANNKKPGADTICQHPACITVGKEDVSYCHFTMTLRPPEWAVNLGAYSLCAVAIPEVYVPALLAHIS